MAILREENAKITSLLLDIAYYVTNRVSANNQNVDIKGLNTKHTVLGEAILNDFYTKQVTSLVNTTVGKTIQGRIRPTVNSWLRLVDIANYTSDVRFDLPPVNVDVINKLYNKVENEYEYYTEDILEKMKRYKFKVNNFMKNSKENKTIENNITISLTQLISFYDLLDEKDWFAEQLINNVPEGSTVPSINSDLTSINSDLEIGLLAKDEFSKLNNKEYIIDVMDELLNVQGLEGFISGLSYVYVNDINALVGLIIVLKNYINENNDNEVAKAMLNAVISKLRVIKGQYDNYVRTDTVVFGFNRTTDAELTIYCLEDTFNKYINENTGSIKNIIGSIFNLDSYNTSVRDTFIPTIIRNDDLVMNSDTYSKLRDSANAAMILANKNNTSLKLRNYYLFALDNIIDGDVLSTKQTEIENFLNIRPLGELVEIDETTVDLFATVLYSNTNFRLFSNYITEAYNMLNTDDADSGIYTAYAIYKLILIYLASQTEVI